ncbi:hypothetical protein [Actinomycetospora sp. TBRC 11914]|uniref:hypothetical protein n=1 Tax=Actinomycetospora sp. TBRC 11914 TaxID=2729387 RepID=UPI00145DC386|nr:hypothetical protein [Actinomycetospora sp. TBRC 11914]NMO93870.1 hypothetical protein [Actinomycetospora sp. TBRC 11914]
MATWTAHTDLPLGEHTVRDARAFALAAAQSWEPDVASDVLLLAVEELTAGVLAQVAREAVPAEHSLVLELDATEDGLRVSLADSSAVRSLAADLAHAAPGLVGLLVSSARGWGDEPHRGGYRIWFELGRPGEPTADPTPSADIDPDVDPDVEAELELRRRRTPTPALRVDPPAAALLHVFLERPR